MGPAPAEADKSTNSDVFFDFWSQELGCKCHILLAACFIGSCPAVVFVLLAFAPDNNLPWIRQRAGPKIKKHCIYIG